VSGGLLLIVCIFAMRARLLSVSHFFFSRRSITALIAYTLILAASFYMAYEIRFDFSIPLGMQEERLRLLKYAVIAKLILLILFRQTGTVLRYFSIPDLLRIGVSMAIASTLLIAPRLLHEANYIFPRGVLLIDLILSVAGLCAFRLGLRVLQERMVLARRFTSKKMERIAIIGAGDTGASLANDLLNMPARGLKPAVFLDDDPRKKGTLVHGISVTGRPEDLPNCKAADVSTVVVAMPSAPQKRIREIVLFLAQHGYKVEIVPALEDLVSGKAKASRIRPVEVEDLLGRDPVELDTTSIRKFVENKVVMVTGAGGSIGSELSRQIARLNPRRLLMIDQSEPALFLIEQELNNGGFSGTAVPLVADILDGVRMNALFSAYVPQVVFHAAAHKHVYLMERQPSEAIKNNAVGTRKLAEIAAAHEAEAFVLISTDKAVNPTNVMGASKRLAELHLQALHGSKGRRAKGEALGAKRAKSEAVAGCRLPVIRVGGQLPVAGEGRGQGAKSEEEGAKGEGGGAPRETVAGGRWPEDGEDGRLRRTKLMAVRFGNVLGSSGSVVPIFKRQIAAGGPVTVTHPDVTRYFMTIPEAVGLVLQASVLGNGGEIFVLDMGQPMKIVDLARHMIELSGFKVGEDIEIKFIGLKPGEKLFEELQHQTEQHVATVHPRIMRFVNGGDAAEASRMAIEEVEPFVDELPPLDIKRSLKVVIPEYEPSLE
jgi:FlaA1/EpsC-like NDP-sugar epimerase